MLQRVLNIARANTTSPTVHKKTNLKFVVWYHTKKPNINPTKVINTARFALKEIPPLALDDVEADGVAAVPAEEPVAVVDVEFVEFAASCAPIVNAVVWKSSNELFEPGAPGLIANTMPLPQ